MPVIMDARETAIPGAKATHTLTTVGALLFIALPVVLVAWARATASVVHIPAVVSPVAGLVTASIGAMLLLLGWQRILTLFPYPVYTGICVICAGASITVGSASGLWLVSPIVAISCAAFILGTSRSVPPTARLIPPPGLWPPTLMERTTSFLCVVLPWLLLYEAVLAIGVPPDAISGTMRFERSLPVQEWTQIVYASTYLVALSAAFIARTRSDLRRFSVYGLQTMLVAYPAYLIIPLIAPKRPFTPHTIPGHLLAWERTLDSPAAAFPSYHVIWAILAAEVFARRWPRLRLVFNGWAILVAVSCVTTSQHSILDIVGGAVTVALVARGPRLWQALRRYTDLVNNSFCAGMAAFFGLWLAGTMAGPRAETLIFVAGVVALVGTLRPIFGPHGPMPGGALGGIVAALSAPLFGMGVWLILAALSLGAGWIQAVRAVRHLGHCKMPVYSVVCDILAALIVTRLWMLATPLHLITGIFLTLTGLSRFVEAAHRKPVRSDRLIAIACVIGGALTTALGHGPAAPAPQFAWNTLLLPVLSGLAVAAFVPTGTKPEKTYFATP